MYKTYKRPVQAHITFCVTKNKYVISKNEKQRAMTSSFQTNKSDGYSLHYIQHDHQYTIKNNINNMVYRYVKTTFQIE